jgi:hypothetical protein
MPDEILKLLREIHEAISRECWLSIEPYQGMHVVPVSREEWLELRDKITSVIEEEEMLWEDTGR